MQGCWRQMVMGMVLAAGLTGCQCCWITEHCTDAVDCIADHEHGLDVLYHPCYDLTRIGRPDWCHCQANRLLCQCRCDRCKPLPNMIDTSAADREAQCPWNDGPENARPEPSEFDQPAEPTEEPGLLPADDSELSPQDDAEEMSFPGGVTAPKLWSLDR